MYQKILLFIIAVIVMPCSMQGAGRPVERVEGGGSFGLSFPIDRQDESCSRTGLNFEAELRYNLPKQPVDIGLMLSFDHNDIDYDRAPVNPVVDPYGIESSSLFVGAVGDYNINRGGKVSPFVGLGVGVAMNRRKCRTIPEQEQDRNTTMGFIPRVGVEFFRHVRVTASFHVVQKYNNTFDITVGFVFGGRPVKHTGR